MTTEDAPKAKDLAFKSQEAIAEQEMFMLAQARAKVYASSSLVPKQYQNNIANVMIATNMAKRMGADVLQVMQNLYIVHGNPSWSAQFLIATFNQNGRFSPIRYRFTGERGSDSWGCIAYCTDRESGGEISGTEVTIRMAKDEGWYAKAGSKWKTMPEQMLRYRAASYMIRTVAPEIGMGLLTKEEWEDVEGATPATRFQPRGNLQSTELVLEPETPRIEAEPGDIEPSWTFLDFQGRMNKTTKYDSLVSLAAEVDTSTELRAGEQESLMAELTERIQLAKAEAGE